MCLLGTPADASSDSLRQLVSEALKEVELQTVPDCRGILFYWERSNLSLSDLEQLGPVAQDAYRQMTATENFPPHPRIDLPFGSVR
jgi:hypothetical protein